jgi:hypothetical protein
MLGTDDRSRILDHPRRAIDEAQSIPSVGLLRSEFRIGRIGFWSFQLSSWSNALNLMRSRKPDEAKTKITHN